MEYKYNKEFFSNLQQQYITDFMILGINKELLDIITAVDNDNNPAFSSSKMFQINEGVKSNFTWDNIKLYCKLDEENKSLYDVGQMREIRYALNEKFSEDIINILTLVKNNKPFLTAEEMNKVNYFIIGANDKQIRELCDAVEEGLNFDQLFLDENIPAEKMRIARSFYKLGCTEKYVKQIIEKDLKMEELKEIKYYINCTNLYNIAPDTMLILQCWKIDDMKEKLFGLMQLKCSLQNTDKDIFFKCIDNKVELELIKFLFEPEYNFNSSEKKDIIFGYESGLSVKLMKKSISVDEPFRNINTIIEELLGDNMQN